MNKSRTKKRRSRGGNNFIVNNIYFIEDKILKFVSSKEESFFDYTNNEVAGVRLSFLDKDNNVITINSPIKKPVRR